MSEFLKNTILPLLLNVAVICVVLKFGFDILLKRAENRWKKTSDTYIETLKSNLAKNNASLSNLLNIYSSNHAFANTKRIESFEVLWTNLLKFKEIIPNPVTTIYNVLLKDEIESFMDRETTNTYTRSMQRTLLQIDKDSYFTPFFEFPKKVETVRPFLGDKIWSCFNVYKIFVGRITHLALSGAHEGKIFHWHEDKAIRNMFRSFLAEDEYKYIYANEISSLELTGALLENKLLLEINKVISGEIVTESALEKVKILEENLKASSEIVSRLDTE